MPECRDLLFHVQEHCHDLLEINPIDPEGKDLMAWHRCEQENPDIFIGMYQLWCQKKQ